MDLKNKASNLGIKYFLLAYSTLNTDSRFFLVPTEGIENVQKNGLCFTPARFFKCGVNECGFKLYPVPETFVQLPWKQEFAWIHGEIYLNDAPFNQCPRSVLRKQVEKAKKLGYLMMAGFEPEFLLLDKDGKDFTYSRAIRQSIHLHDGRSIMRDSKLLCRIHGVMETLGWKPYQIVHEDSICQYEINFGYADALETADRYFFMKFMVKELAEEEGYTATFMPIPSSGDLICANGLHINMSLWSDQEKTNLFPDNKDKEIGISKLARHFIGGLLEHVQESCAVLCPTVNSYKRINAGSWCPSIINWGTNNKSVMLRIPANDRVEHRLPDGGTNLYLTLALLLAAGLDGMIKNTEPGPMTSKEAHPEAKKLPNNLYEALSAMKTSDFVMKCLGPDIVDGFVLLKMQEWNLYVSQITKWEKEFYLDC